MPLGNYLFNPNNSMQIKPLIVKQEQEEDFDLSKDTKFSIRTLILLSVFGIGVFLFGIEPKFFGYELAMNAYWAFA